jgi:tetratricopeptide (TPR) repeat protein
LQNTIAGLIDRLSEEPLQADVRPAESLSAEEKNEIDIAYRTAQELFKKGDIKRAIEHWESIEQLAPNYLAVREYLVNAYKFVGVEFYGMNRLQEAVDVWKRAMLLDPNNDEIRSYITRTEIEIRKTRELSYDQR